MQDFRITVEESPRQKDLDAVVEGLRGYNAAYTGGAGWERLVVLLREGEGVRGGLVGELYWGWMHVSTLWVHEALRGRGHGARLLRTAEEEALRRGCRAAHLDTFSFQARPFYERLGYTVFGVLEDFPEGHTRYFLRKRLER